MSDAVKKSRRWGKAPDHPLDVEMRNSPLVVKKHFRGKWGRDRLHSRSLRKGVFIGHLLTAKQQHDAMHHHNSKSLGAHFNTGWLLRELLDLVRPTDGSLSGQLFGLGWCFLMLIVPEGKKKWSWCAPKMVSPCTPPSFPCLSGSFFSQKCSETRFLTRYPSCLLPFCYWPGKLIALFFFFFFFTLLTFSIQGIFFFISGFVFGWLVIHV